MATVEYKIVTPKGVAHLDARVWEPDGDNEWRNRNGNRSRLTLIDDQWVYTDPVGFRWNVLSEKEVV